MPDAVRSTKLAAKRKLKKLIPSIVDIRGNLCYRSNRKRLAFVWSKARWHIHVIYFGFSERTAAKQLNQRISTKLGTTERR